MSWINGCQQYTVPGNTGHAGQHRASLQVKAGGFSVGAFAASNRGTLEDFEQQPTAQRLADKSVFVRKKLTTTTQCNLNKNIRFLYE